MKKESALSAFYENLAHGQHDIDYYLSPIGISRRAEILTLIQGACTDLIGDFGCGDGLIALKLRRDKRKVLGCDLSYTRARRAKTIGIEVACADVMQLPFAAASFDWVICSEVIEHVIDPQNVLGEIFRVLSPGGAAVLTVPLGEKLGCTLLDVPEDQLAVESYQKIRERFQVKGSHLTSFSKTSFQEMVVSCGFKIDRVNYTRHFSLRYPRNPRLACILQGKRLKNLVDSSIYVLTEQQIY